MVWRRAGASERWTRAPRPSGSSRTIVGHSTLWPTRSSNRRLRILVVINDCYTREFSSIQVARHSPPASRRAGQAQYHARGGQVGADAPAGRLIGRLFSDRFRTRAVLEAWRADRRIRGSAGPNRLLRAGSWPRFTTTDDSA